MITKNKKLLIIVTLPCMLLLLNACGDDDSPTPEVASRFALMVVTDPNTQAGLLIPFDSLGKTIDVNTVSNAVSIGRGLPAGISFGDAVYNIYNGAGEIGIAKYQLQEDGTFADEQFIVGDNNSRIFEITSETSGYYINVALDDKAIQKFNPSTMERTGSIDISSAIDPLLTDEVEFVRYGSLKAMNERLFAEVQFRDAANGNPFDSVFVAIVNTATEQVEGMAIYEGERFALASGSSPNSRFETFGSDGTIYYGPTGYVLLSDFADWGGHLIRINAGELDFDPNFELNLDGEGILFGINFLQDRIYSFQSDQATLQPGFSNQVFLYEINPGTLENRKIESWPVGSFLSGVGPLEYEGMIYGFVPEDENWACYRYDPATDTSEKVFTLIGGSPTELFILE
ncbi:MAG: hypothetical protein AAF693_20140 [Bacteroidota bacterium]